MYAIGFSLKLLPERRDYTPLLRKPKLTVLC